MFEKHKYLDKESIQRKRRVSLSANSSSLSVVTGELFPDTTNGSPCDLIFC